MRIVCLSDTHSFHWDLAVPDGDVLVHAGDMTLQGTRAELERFAEWFVPLPHRHKVVIAGNHDWLFQREPELARRCLGDVGYLQDSGLAIGGLRFWGSPWQPWFLSWAFNLPRGRPLREKWSQIPEGTDVLITHGPPFGIHDRVAKVFPRVVSAVIGQGEHVGCRDLLAAVTRLAPRLHVFGHIHEGYGSTRRGETLHVNASICDARYRPANPPHVVDLD
jgi:predicted phosphodiesterase